MDDPLDWLHRNGSIVSMRTSNCGNYIGVWTAEGGYSMSTFGASKEVLYQKLYSMVKASLLDECDMEYNEFYEIEYGDL